MRAYDLLGDGKPQSSAAAIGRTRRIQAIELLKDHLELWLGDRIALVHKSYAYATVAQTPGLDRNCRAFIAIGNGVFHDVIEYASHLVAVHEHRQVLADINLGFLALFLLGLTEPVTGFSLGLNFFNALTVGILGVPGLVLLVLLQMLFV